MKAKKIKNIFNMVYNNLPNPIFCYPILYFQRGPYICEIAASINSYREAKWDDGDLTNSNPLLILEGLFFEQGYWITVLKRTKDNKYEKTNLNTHFEDWKKELNSFINTKLYE